jgi:tetratricopeptide (TPR) repeat protein
VSRAEGMGGAGALEERRRIVLRDLEELAQQVADGEIDEATASRLEAGYRAELAEVERALKARPSRQPKARDEAAGSPAPARAAAPARSSSGILWAMGAVILALTGVIVFLATRAGEEEAAASTTTQASLPDDIAEMEAVVAAHPESNAMRLALAGLYFDRGEYLGAMEHYLVVLENAPTPEEESVALARVGWMAYLTDQVDTAVGYLEQAIAVDSAYGEAKLFLGVVLLYGEEDPAAALPVLEEVLTFPDLPAEVRLEVEQMVEEARAAAGGGG